MARLCNQCSNKIKYKFDSTSSRPSGEKEFSNMMKKGFSMVQSFAISMISRGLNNKKVDIPVKQLRVLSCFGDKNNGGNISPCKHLIKSSTEDKFYCGECGCGDKRSTWLISNSEEYSKLDYPKLNCPLKMPGFSNYEIAPLDDDKRKKQIENYDLTKLAQIIVTSPEPQK